MLSKYTIEIKLSVDIDYTGPIEMAPLRLLIQVRHDKVRIVSRYDNAFNDLPAEYLQENNLNSLFTSHMNTMR